MEKNKRDQRQIRPEKNGPEDFPAPNDILSRFPSGVNIKSGSFWNLFSPLFFRAVQKGAKTRKSAERNPPAGNTPQGRFENSPFRPHRPAHTPALRIDRDCGKHGYYSNNTFWAVLTGLRRVSPGRPPHFEVKGAIGFHGCRP